MAPVCHVCGTVSISFGGTFGITAVYGVNDPALTRQRVQADLQVLIQYERNLHGLIAANKEQLDWGVEKYAKLPAPPELIPTVDVPNAVNVALESSSGCLLGLAVLAVLVALGAMLEKKRVNPMEVVGAISVVLGLPALVVFVVTYLFSLPPSIKAKLQNGSAPQENNQRQQRYNLECQQALEAAEPIKAAQDHRMRCQICDSEASIKTVRTKAESIRSMLAHL